MCSHYEEVRVTERYLKLGKRPQPLTWEEVTAVNVTYKALTPRLAARFGNPDVVEELAEFKAHDAKEFPHEGEMRVIAAVATLCGQKDITEWGVKALVACLERPDPATDPATKAMWKKLKVRGGGGLGGFVTVEQKTSKTLVCLLRL